MRKQTTTHLRGDQKEWLPEYASGLGLGESELLRILVERERRTRWLETVLNNVSSPTSDLSADTLERWLQQAGSR